MTDYDWSEIKAKNADHVRADKPVKQVIVIRKDLKMRRGKEIAQGAHASMAWLTHRMRKAFFGTDRAHLDVFDFSGAEIAWIESNFRKVTLQVDTEEELLAVYEKAKAAGLEVHLIADAGLTEFGGQETHTAVGVGPDHHSEKDRPEGE